jgi:raffinose/stachyose/melibiose transport system substrate-binding protein
VKELAKAYPNVELNLIVQSQDDGETLKTLAATGQLPDIFQAGTEIINTLRETGQVMVLNDVAEKSGYLDKVYDSCENLVYADDGNIYAFPYAGQEYVLWYYNKAIFEQCGLEVPKTYDELLNCISVFKEKGITPMALFGQEGWITTAMYDSIATRYTAGGIKDLDVQKAEITDDNYVKAADTLSQLVEAGLFQNDVTTTNYDQASEMFLSGQAAMFLNGQWYIEDATKALGDNVDWMYYPSFDEASYESGKTAFAGGGSTSGYAVNPDGQHAQLAAEVAEFLAEKYCEAKVMYRNNPLVTLDTGAKSETALPTMMQKLSDSIPTITSTTKFTWGLTNSVFSEGIQTETQGLISNQYTADEFISDMTDTMSRMND